MTRLDGVVELRKGGIVEFQSRIFRILRVLDMETVQLVDEQTGKTVTAQVAHLRPPKPEETPSRASDLEDYSEEDWEHATLIHKIIEPVLYKVGRTRKEVVERAKEFGLHANTLYGRLRDFEANPHLTTLMRKRRADAGKTNLEPEQEEILKAVIDSEYLTTKSKSISEVHEKLEDACKTAGVHPPHKNTLRNRIKKLTARVKTALREGRQAAKEKFDAVLESVFGADWPLAIAQIDHTLLNIELVDTVYRRPCGRPWLTVLFDVFSRMVLGFYLSLDPPGNMGTGLCIFHGVLPKEVWLTERGLPQNWPCWGKPNVIHGDNAREFKGRMLRTACKEHLIDLIWRPVAHPEYGAHIERWLGTFKQMVHALPGATSRNLKQKRVYDSEAHAKFTLDEAIQWVTLRMFEYHSHEHSGLGGISPREKWEQGIRFGTGNFPAVGLPDRIVDPSAQERLRLDLMPFEMRTVQRDGIVIDKIHYFSPVLQPWINSVDPEHPNLKRKFRIRRDYHRISHIWFYDPELQQHFEVPYRNTSLPPMSIWDLRESRAFLKKQGVKNRDVDERLMKEAHEQRLQLEEKAEGRTKKARKSRERRHHWGKTSFKTATPAAEPTTTASAGEHRRLEPFSDDED